MERVPILCMYLVSLYCYFVVVWTVIKCTGTPVSMYTAQLADNARVYWCRVYT